MTSGTGSPLPITNNLPQKNAATNGAIERVSSQGEEPSLRHPLRSTFREAGAAAAALAIGALPWYLAQYPGRLTWDTVDQLWQAAGTKSLDNAHPVFFTLLLRGLYPHIGAYVLLQILGFACAMGLVLALAAKRFSLRTESSQWKRVALVAFLLGLIPSVGSYLDWIVKDIPFTAALLLAATAWAVSANDRLFTVKTGGIVGMLSALPWMFRHDGATFAAMSILAGTLLAKRHPLLRRRWYPSFLATFFAVNVLRLAVPAALGATMSPGLYAGGFVHDISGFLRLKGQLDAVDTAFIAKFADPQELGARFQFQRGDMINVPPRILNLNWLENHPSEFLKGYFRLAKKNLSLLIQIRWALFEHQIGVLGLDILDTWENPNPGLPFQLKPLAFGIPLRSFLERSVEVEWMRILLWCSLWPILALLAVFVWALKARALGTAMFCLFPIVNALVFYAIACVGTFRYNYYLLPFGIAALLSISRRGAFRLGGHNEEVIRRQPRAETVTRLAERIPAWHGLDTRSADGHIRPD